MEQKPFNVTLPWNPSNSNEGDYATTVWAADADAAVELAAAEMADKRAGSFDNESERSEYIQLLIEDGGDVIESSNDLRYNLEVVFGKQLFPDGVSRTIDLDALAEVLAENRERLVAPPAKRPSMGR